MRRPPTMGPALAAAAAASLRCTADQPVEPAAVFQALNHSWAWARCGRVHPRRRGWRHRLPGRPPATGSWIEMRVKANQRHLVLFRYPILIRVVKVELQAACGA